VSPIDWDDLDSPDTTASIEASTGPGTRALVQGVDDPLRARKTLESWAISSGPIRHADILTGLNALRSDQFESTHEYITEFQNTLRTLVECGRRVDEIEPTNASVAGAAEQYRTWPSSMRSLMRRSRPSLEDVVADLRDRASIPATEKAVGFNGCVDNRRTGGNHRKGDKTKKAEKKRTHEVKLEPGGCPRKAISTRTAGPTTRKRDLPG
jgi:hypothetical protein